MVTLKAQCCRRTLSEAIKQAQSHKAGRHQNIMQNATHRILTSLSNVNQIYNQKSMFNQIPYSLQSSVPDALRFYLLIKQTYLTLPPVMKVGVSPAKKDRKEGKKTQKGWEKQWPSRIFQFSNLLKASLIPYCGLYRPLAQQLCLEYYHETRSWAIIVHLSAYSKLI